MRAETVSSADSLRKFLSVALIMLLQQDVCREEYRSAEEFKKSGRDNGFSLGFEGFELGYSGGKRTGSGKLSFANEEFCKSNRLELDDFYINRVKKSIANIALDAWRECIKTTKDRNFSIEYEETIDNDGVIGHFKRSIGDGEITHYILTDMKVIPPDDSVECQVNGKTIKRGGDINLKMTGLTESFGCSKPKNKNISIGIGTNIGDPIFIKMYSAKVIDDDKLDKLSKKINYLNDKSHKEINEIKKQLGPVNKWPSAINCGSAWDAIFVLHGNPRNNTVSPDNLAHYVQVYPHEYRSVRFNADGSYFDRKGHNESSLYCEGKGINQLRKENKTYQFPQR